MQRFVGILQTCGMVFQLSTRLLGSVIGGKHVSLLYGRNIKDNSYICML